MADVQQQRVALEEVLRDDCFDFTVKTCEELFGCGRLYRYNLLDIREVSITDEEGVNESDERVQILVGDCVEDELVLRDH